MFCFVYVLLCIDFYFFVVRQSSTKLSLGRNVSNIRIGYVVLFFCPFFQLCTATLQKCRVMFGKNCFLRTILAHSYTTQAARVAIVILSLTQYGAVRSLITHFVVGPESNENPTPTNVTFGP